MRLKAGAATGPARDGGRWDGDDGPGALEIEFEDDEAPSAATSGPTGRWRDLRPAALVALAVVTLGAALSAMHRVGSNAADDAAIRANVPIVGVAEPDYAAYMVTVRYEDARLISLPARQIEVGLRITPVPGASIKVLNYYVDENGVNSAAQPAPTGRTLPAAGVDARLRLTVTDCSVVPIGESMSFVNVVADGPAGVTDRFTILGERYATDLARLLRTVCPGRAGGQNPLTSSGRVTGP